MKVLIAAGGTGGHIYPGVAIAKKIIENNPDADILFVGSYRGMEKELIPKEGFKINFIRVRGFERRISINTIRSIRDLFLSIIDSKRIIKKFKPDIVIGTGGYVCGPVLYISSKKKIPSLIHEQNAFPGVTNRLLSKYVNKIAISFEESKKYFKSSKKIFLSGNPIRKDFFMFDRNDCKKKLNIPEDSKLIISLGGSQGATSINNSMLEVIKYYKGNNKVYIVHVTGKKQFQKCTNNLKNSGININDYKNITILDYAYNVPLLYNAADLVISRAGAMTVSEIAAVGVPSILIPFPYATDNHQEYNARVISDKDGGILILDKYLNGKVLIKTIENIIFNQEKLNNMREKTTQNSKVNATDIICREIVKLMN